MQTNFELVALVLAKPFNSTLSPGQMDLQVVASGRKLSLDLGWLGLGGQTVKKLALTCVISTKVNASHHKSTQVDAMPGQTESRVEPSYQLASTCDSVWPGL